MRVAISLLKFPSLHDSCVALIRCRFDFTKVFVVFKFIVPFVILKKSFHDIRSSLCQWYPRAAASLRSFSSF